MSVTGFCDNIQYTTYDQSGKYDWHMDFSAGRLSLRKVSISVLLNSPTEFTGGKFETLTVKAPASADLHVGDAIMFPSYVTHRVTPVTSGQRRSLVAWICGPPFC